MKRRLKTFEADSGDFALLDKASSLRTQALGRNVPERDVIRAAIRKVAANDAFREAPALFKARLAAIRADRTLNDERRARAEEEARAEYAAAWQELLDVCERFGVPVDERHREVKP